MKNRIRAYIHYLHNISLANVRLLRYKMICIPNSRTVFTFRSQGHVVFYRAQIGIVLNRSQNSIHTRDPERQTWGEVIGSFISMSQMQGASLAWRIASGRRTTLRCGGELNREVFLTQEFLFWQHTNNQAAPGFLPWVLLEVFHWSVQVAMHYGNSAPQQWRYIMTVDTCWQWGSAGFNDAAVRKYMGWYLVIIVRWLCLDGFRILCHSCLVLVFTTLDNPFVNK